MVQTGLFALKKKKGNGESDFIGLNYGFVAIWVSLYCLLFLFLLLVLLLFFFSLRGRLRGITLSGCFLFCILAVCWWKEVSICELSFFDPLHGVWNYLILWHDYVLWWTPLEHVAAHILLFCGVLDHFLAVWKSDFAPTQYLLIWLAFWFLFLLLRRLSVNLGSLDAV